MYRNTPVRGLQTQQRRPRCGKEDSNVTVVIRVDQPPVVSFFFETGEVNWMVIPQVISIDVKTIDVIDDYYR